MPNTRRHRTSVLRKCGFEQEDSGRSPEEKWVFRQGGRLSILTSLPRGNREIRKGTFSAILKQLHLDQDEYGEFYRCRWRLLKYLEILREKRILPA